MFTCPTCIILECALIRTCIIFLGSQSEEEPKKERTRDVLAKLLTGMVSGMMGTDEEEEEEEGEGKEKGGKETQKEGKEEKKDPKKGEKSEEEEEEEEEDEDKDDEDDDDDPKKTFAEKYVGPPGSIVTIQSIPQPPFGIPTMNPQPGPSLCIRNTGDPNKPDVSIYMYTYIYSHVCRDLIVQIEVRNSCCKNEMGSSGFTRRKLQVMNT